MKFVEVVADAGSSNTIVAMAAMVEARDVRLGAVCEDGKQQLRILVSDDKLQSVLDKLQNVLGSQPEASIIVMAVEASLPKLEAKERAKEDSAIAAREALYEEVEKSARLDTNYLLLTILSTVVAAVGLIENNVAVVVGAMVIAPLLGPNLALSFGAALGDIRLIRTSAQTLLVGIALALTLSALLGNLWPTVVASPELILRTQVGLDSVVLAIATGAAAALSLTTGLSSVLVGVMVAVALLPPVVTLGITFGQKNMHLAINAGLLLAVNIVCVNLASRIVFFEKGIRPRSWLEKHKAKHTMVVYVLGWFLSLIVLIVLTYAHRSAMG